MSVVAVSLKKTELVGELDLLPQIRPGLGGPHAACKVREGGQSQFHGCSIAGTSCTHNYSLVPRGFTTAMRISWAPTAPRGGLGARAREGSRSATAGRTAG